MESGPSLLILTEDSPGSFSPAGERVRQMALNATPFDRVFVLALERSKKLPVEKGDFKVLLYEVNWWRGLPYPISAFFDPVKALLFAAFGLWLSLRVGFNCVLVSMPPIEAGIGAWLLAKISGKTLIVDLRDDWESSLEVNLKRYIPLGLMKPLFKLAHVIYSSSVAIFTATETIADTVKKRGIQTPTLNVPNGADTSLFFPRNANARRELRVRRGLPVDKAVVVYCGSAINPYYRLDKVLSSAEALNEAAKKAIFLVFYVYNGIDYLQGLKKRLRIPENLVDVRDPVSRNDLAEVLAASDVGLLPFDDSSYLVCARSTKLYEYLASGLYVICSGPDNGELDRFFSYSPNLGFFTEPTVEGFNRAFEAVLDERQSLFEDEHRGPRYTFIKENFDRKKIMMRAMEVLWDKLPSRRHKASD